LLTPESIRLMQTPMVPCGDGDWVGLTWTVEEIDGIRFYCHGGTTNGQESDFWIAPERKTALTVLTNLDRGDQLHKALRIWVREHFLGAVKKLPAVMEVSAEELAGYSLSFFTSAGDSLEIHPKDGRFTIQHVILRTTESGELAGSPLAPMRAAFYEKDRFLVFDPPFQDALGEFLTASGGEIRWMRMGGRIFPLKE
jgi:hypothetical protein